MPKTSLSSYLLITMATISEQEYMRVLGDLERLTTKFMALEQENQRLLGDLQQVNVEKAQQHEELTQRVHQLEATLITLRQQASQAPRTQDKSPI